MWSNWFLQYDPEQFRHHSNWIDILNREALDTPNLVTDLDDIDFQSLLEKP